MFQFNFKTACAPVFVPIDSNEDINYRVIPEYHNYLNKKGIKSFFINGGCGEFTNLTLNDRKNVLEKWANAINNDDQIVVNIGTANMSDTIDLGNHALQFNVSALVIVPPYYMPVCNESDLLEYLMSVCKSLSRQLPILYYHIPSVTKANIDLGDFLSLAQQRNFTQLSAIKFSHSNESDLQRMMFKINDIGCQLNVYCGYELLMEESINLGAKGCVLSFVNILPVEVNAIFDGAMTESKKKLVCDVRRIFSAIVEFASEQRVQIMALLKMAAALASGIPLGLMRQPYAIGTHHANLFRQLLVKIELITDQG